jgi:hypothetical protein
VHVPKARPPTVETQPETHAADRSLSNVPANAASPPVAFGARNRDTRCNPSLRSITNFVTEKITLKTEAADRSTLTLTRRSDVRTRGATQS